MKIRELVPFKKNREEEQAQRDDWGPFYMFRHGMNRLFEDFVEDFNRFPLSPYTASAGGTFGPRIDVSETEKEILVTAELPGMEEKEIDLLLSKDTLTLKGEKKMEKEEKERGYHRLERVYGSFCRTIPLPGDVEKDKVTASFRQGVLKVTLPKSEKSIKEAKRIEIKKG